MFERFTERARKVVVLAQEEARQFNHNYIGTEHLLLGLLREDTGVAAQALGAQNIVLSGVREQVEVIVGHGEEEPGGHVPFTQRSKKVLELSLRESMQLGHNYIGTEHILLGLMGDREGVAARVLFNLDVDPDKIRREVVQMLGVDFQALSRAFLSLGSNLGDRLAYLRAAMDALARGPRMSLTGLSKVYETAPVEVEGEQPDYLNCVAEMECSLPAVELLRYCQGVEAVLGRDDKGMKTPRTVDLDVLLFGGEVIEEPDLIVPHPGILRAFNLRGLADLAPDLYVPGRGVVVDLLSEADLRGVREMGEAGALC